MEAIADFMEENSVIRIVFLDKPLGCGVDNRLEASKTRFHRWSSEAAAVIQVGYDKGLNKVNND